MSLQSLDRALSKTTDRSVGDIVAAYGSNVQKLKMDAASGKIDPTKAVMAMMAIQRIVAANTQPPPGTTVAQDTGIAPPPQPMMPPPAAPQQPPMRMAYGGQVAVSNNQVPSPAMERGLSGLPVPDNMFDYAEGGMIAFGDGGDVKRFQGLSGSYVGKPRQELMMLLQLLPPEDPRRLQIQEELRNLDAMEAARTRGGIGSIPLAAEPTAAPPAAPTAMRGQGINLNSLIQRATTPQAIGSPDVKALMTKAEEAYPMPIIAAPNREKIAGEQLEAAKKFGYDPTLTQTQLEENRQEREDLKGKRKEAADMAILKAGLNILGGTSPYAFVNIGKGGSEAAKEFAADIRDLQKMQMQLKKDEQILKRAANQDALQQSEKSEAAYREALRNKEAAEQKVYDRRASLTNAFLQGEYGNLREVAQQAGSGLRQAISTLGGIETANINAASAMAGYGLGGGRLSDMKTLAGAKSLRDNLQAQLDSTPVDDPNRTALQQKLAEADRNYNNVLEAVRETRGSETKERAAAASSQRAETDRTKAIAETERSLKLGGSNSEYKRRVAKDGIDSANAWARGEAERRHPPVSGAKPSEAPKATPSVTPPKPKPEAVPAGHSLGSYNPSTGWEVYKNGELVGYMQPEKPKK